VHEADLVGIHEARVAHHVAAIGKVDGQHRATAVLNSAAAVVVQLLVVVGLDVAPRKHVFQMLEERGVNRHRVFEMPVNRAVLDHDDLAVFLGDGGLDLADLFGQERLERLGAIEDGLPGLAHAGGTQRVGLTGPAKRRLRLLIRLQQWLVRPLGDEGRILADLVGAGKHLPGTVRRDGQSFFHVLNGRVHLLLRSGQAGWAAAVTGACLTIAPFYGGFSRSCAVSPSGPLSPVSGHWTEFNGHIRLE
jgi:hypothetical protein